MKGDFNKIIKNHVPVLIDFYADWCGPCKTLSPVIKEVADMYQGKINVIKINVDKNQKIAARFAIKSIPTIIMFKKGKQLHKKVGLITKKELQKLIEPHI